MVRHASQHTPGEYVGTVSANVWWKGPQKGGFKSELLHRNLGGDPDPAHQHK